MLPVAADPVVHEAARLRHELRLTRRARDAEVERLGFEGVEAERVGALHPDADTLALLSEAQADLESRLSTLLADPVHGPIISSALDARAAALRIAVDARRAERARSLRRASADQLMARAAASGRALTAAEHDRVTDLRAAADQPTEKDGWEPGIVSTQVRDEVLDALSIMRLREAAHQLRGGVLLTEQMRRIISEALPAARRGDPVLLLGETGGAKTALAEHLAARATGTDSEFVSGYGDITGAQVIGAHELRSDGGATVSTFVAGPLLRAMTQGRALILDEINAMPAEFLKRLNRILQLRPGDRYAVQENAGRVITIAPGFAILATANEQTPHRYRGLDRLSAELINRFGANAYRVHYPDTGNDYTDFPAENALLATAAVVDRHGELPRGLTAADIERVSRAAFISQQVFAGTHGEGFDGYVTTEREIDGRPGLEESVLAPRTLVAILQKVAGSGGAVTLDQALGRFIEGIMHREDRRVLALVLQGQGFAV